MSTIPCPGVVQLDLRTRLDIAAAEAGLVNVTVKEVSLLDGRERWLACASGRKKEAVVLYVIGSLDEGGHELSRAAADVLKEIGKYAVERLCQGLGGN